MTKEKAIQHIKRALEIPNRIGLALVDDEALNFVVEELSKDAQPTPCDFCIHNIDCEDARIYCPAMPKEGD